MAKQKTAWVAFKAANLVPGAVFGETKDRRMQPGEPVELPAAYAAHVVSEGFAVPSEKPQAPSGADKKKAAEISAAEQALADAQAVLDGLEEGADGYEAAVADVDAFRAVLDKLTA